MAKEYLTNERLKGLFKSNFDLANYAIALARYDVKSGKEFTIEKTLDDIARNPRVLQDRKLLDEMDDEEDTEE